MIRESGAKAHIPSTRNRLIQRTVNRRVYRKRNLVERYFNKIRHFKRIATRFAKTREKLPRCRRARLDTLMAQSL